MKQLEVKGLKPFACTLTALVCAQIVWRDNPWPFCICMLFLLATFLFDS